MTGKPLPEFSRVIGLDELGDGPVRRDLEADAAERDSLARRFDLLSLDSFKASLELRRISGGPLICVEGRLAADVVQRCVVTLEPVPDHVNEPFSDIFGPPGYQPGGEEEPPDPFDDDSIDVGELVAQCLSLALEPYPRVPESETPFTLAGEDAADTGGSPFAKLAKLKKKR